MLESTPKYPLKHAHHRKHLATLVLAIVVFVMVMVGYIFREPIKEQLALIVQSDPIVILRRNVVSKLGLSLYTRPTLSEMQASLKKIKSVPIISIADKENIINQLRQGVH